LAEESKKNHASSVVMASGKVLNQGHVAGMPAKSIGAMSPLLDDKSY